MKRSTPQHLPRIFAGAALAFTALAGWRRYRKLAQTPGLSERSQVQGIVGRHIQAGPWRIYTKSAGAEDAQVVVLVHGLVISSRYMEPLALALASNGYRVLAPDLPGYGESVEGAPRSALPIEILANVLFLWLNAVGLKKATFIGNSFGCQVLTMLAVLHPRAVERLVLQGPTVDPSARSLIRQIGRDILNGRLENIDRAPLSDASIMRKRAHGGRSRPCAG
jgi:pimeloyl-ACP methyl ester carboxylesterase